MILRTMTKMTKILLKVRQSTKISIMWWDMSGSSKAGTRHWTLITDKWTARHYNAESHILYFSFIWLFHFLWGFSQANACLAYLYVFMLLYIVLNQAQSRDGIIFYTPWERNEGRQYYLQRQCEQLEDLWSVPIRHFMDRSCDHNLACRLFSPGNRGTSSN